MTVPYSGAASYFGRKVTRTREHATVQGVNDDGTVLVLVRRGQSAEHHTFRSDQLRRVPVRGGRAVASRVGRAKARLELRDLRARRRSAAGDVERLTREFDCLEARAKLMDQTSREYRTALARLGRLRNELDAERMIAGELERADSGYADPFAVAGNPRPTPDMIQAVAAIVDAAGWSGFADDIRAGRMTPEHGLRVIMKSGTAEQKAIAEKAARALYGHGYRSGRNPLPRSLDPRSIRTVRAGASRIRVGCPAGQYHPRARGRRKCAGAMRAFEKLTPMRRARKPRTRKNPGHSGELARARRLFREWHSDAAPRRARLTRVRVPARPRALARVGELVSVTYESDKYAGTPDNPKGRRQLYEHETKRPRPVIAIDQNGHVHLVGGRMKPTADGFVN